MVERPIDALLRAQERAFLGVRQGWDLLLKTSAAASVPDARGAAQSLQQTVAALAQIVTNAAEPLVALVEGQREIADKLERWAELQRDTADVLSGLAKQQRLTADLLGATVAPFVRSRDADGNASQV
jgi:hypothetical protein